MATFATSMYTGKDDSRETALGSKVVKKLSRELVGGNYHLYFDNFFSSVPLLEDLVYMHAAHFARTGEESLMPSKRPNWVC